MNRKLIFLGISILTLILFSGSFLIFSQEDGETDGNFQDIVAIENDAIITNLEEYPNTYDKVVVGSDTDAEGTHYRARKTGNILTISYYESTGAGVEQSPSISRIPYRNKNNQELRYVDTTAYDRPFVVLRYEFESSQPDARLKKKELLDKNGNVIEYYTYEYDENVDRVNEFTKYELSPFMNEFQVYEVAQFHYQGDSTDPVYYDVLDGMGNVKFTYSYTADFEVIPEGVDEVFIQYKPNVDVKNSSIKSGTGLISESSADTPANPEGNDTLIMSFDASTIQFVVASSTTDNYTLIFNGDGSLRKSIDNRGTTTNTDS